MNINIQFNTDNAAFEDVEEIRRVLEKTVVDITEYNLTSGIIRDINGNTVGNFTVN